jgi:nucleotide-binding universal stress UspA family protein
VGDRLIDAAAVARRAVPGLEVAWELRWGSPRVELIAASARAQLLVVGDRGRVWWDRAVRGSVSRGVARRAICPVVVVRDRPRPTTTGPPATVVVGVDGSPAGERAVGFAFAAAAARGVGLVAVQAWHEEPVDPGPCR